MNDTILPLTTLLIVHYIGNHKTGPAAILFHMGKPWTLGMGPTISIDWKEDSDNRLTFPIGLGITKTTRWGKTPVKLRAEVNYSIISPEDFGSTWNLRLQITPVRFSCRLVSGPFRLLA